MFYLQELFDDLAHGVFANMAIGQSQTTMLSPAEYPRVVNLVNQGLLDIYTQLPMKMKEFDVYQREGITTYYLRPAYVGDPNAGNPNIYIDGTGVDPVNGDIIKLVSAVDEEGNKMYLNDRRYPEHIFTPEPDILKMTIGDILHVITFTYQASYPRIIVVEGFDPLTYVLDFPHYIKKALLLYVASKYFVGKAANAAEGQQTLSQTFMYQYIQEIAALQKNALDIREMAEPEQFTEGGWV